MTDILGLFAKVYLVQLPETRTRTPLLIQASERDFVKTNYILSWWLMQEGLCNCKTLQNFLDDGKTLYKSVSTFLVRIKF